MDEFSLFLGGVGFRIRNIQLDLWTDPDPDPGLIFHFSSIEIDRTFYAFNRILPKTLWANAHETFGNGWPSDKELSVRFWDGFGSYPDLDLVSLSFLSRVSILLLTRDIDIAILSVCPSVCLSVTRWYCMKTA